MKQNPVVILLDSYAFLAYLEHEAGAVRVTDVLHQAQTGLYRVLMTTINLGEVLDIIERERGLQMAQRVLALVESLPITLIDADKTLVFEAAHIKAHHPLSFADAFAAAAALRENAILLTGDPEFRSVEELIQLEWVE